MSDDESRRTAEADLAHAVLHAASKALTGDDSTSDPLPIARELVERYDPEEGLRLVAWALWDAQVRVPAWVVAAIRDLTAGVVPRSELPADLDDLAG